MSKHSIREVSLVLPAGQRLDKFLAAYLKDVSGEKISRSELQRLIESAATEAGAGQITGIPSGHLKSSFRPKRDMEIKVRLPSKAATKLVPLDLKIPIVYEDSHLAVVHKPIGMTVHPGAGTGDDTLVHALLSNLDRLAPDAERPGIVHRLDRETEGLMLIAKTDRARSALSAAFAAHEIRKSYAALVWGKVTFPDEIAGYIFRDPHSRKKMKFAELKPEGRSREAILEISRQKNYLRFTELAIKLITGRTHQIRATMAYLNAPIIGDVLYGNDVRSAKLHKVSREDKQVIEASGMMLIARSLAFKHPVSKKNLEFTLPLPRRFTNLKKALAT